MLEVILETCSYLKSVTDYKMIICFFQVASFLCDGIVESLQTYMNIIAPGVLMCVYHLLNTDRWMILHGNGVWLSKLFLRIMSTNTIPGLWRKAKVIAIEKPGKDPKLDWKTRQGSQISSELPSHFFAKCLSQVSWVPRTWRHCRNHRRDLQSRPGRLPEELYHLWCSSLP